jgi:hypothetical protein
MSNKKKERSKGEGKYLFDGETALSCTTAKQACSALKVAFEDKGINNRCRLLGRLVSLSWSISRQYKHMSQKL